MMNQKKIITIYGPTASGKSSLALDLCDRFDAVIVNADSVQLLKGLPILTAFPLACDMEKHKHFLYGVLEPNQQPNAMLWYKNVVDIIKNHPTKKIILVGGTGLYLKTLFNGMAEIPSISSEVLREVEVIQKSLGDGFYDYVIGKDPLIEDFYHANDHKRLARALAVFLECGSSIVEKFENPALGGMGADCYKIYLRPERPLLHARIAERLNRMIQNGAIEQVHALLEKDINAHRYPVFHAVGAKEIALYLEKKLSYDQMIQRSIEKTRQYAKRQYTWFNNQFEHDLVIDDFAKSCYSFF
jgi:tRNA dimethylallyltransferase